MNVLAIDTSNQVLGVAISKDGEVKTEYTANIKRNYSVGLMPAIDHVMQESQTTPDQLDRIVVAKGPGSYTGVRIGLATAKTMAWTLNIPIVAISSLELLAHNVRQQNVLISPFFDARRGLVYTGLYESNYDRIHVKKEDQNILMEQWLDELQSYQKTVIFLSQDIKQHQGLIRKKLAKSAIFPPAIDHLPRPGQLALLGTQRNEDNLHELTPNYIRLVEAEANWLKEQEKNG
ncbi:tRNA (adenosine(37)-N6)-threonylcarbamoyltransferase complex dimerization subunit type 1 TsaB [Gracilibacillus salitolerans]|uniref:tRNA (Adenosine(37)-N6)-threonylcarbamoyltransferase complex dimerization subunit type 1 TsaB n=1 Tax=Gracilibacillus salitolerans TaxID=2663022 RepID=A0A5Q2TEE7_9BACI|nr:tRNA (adenosine(37)-N6)-threonylcarbamoyltransferase complex dimerization subunit type 1 TsaB [Gracilibacillus salitolerans]QGH33134.1 tRNA (adenosine(37)-N6)-threonylcarbamoyltransferase complex dimerization subunit type 1 TsaB [Gracilibacillus salitolerans]